MPLPVMRFGSLAKGAPPTTILERMSVIHGSLRWRSVLDGIAQAGRGRECSAHAELVAGASGLPSPGTSPAGATPDTGADTLSLVAISSPSQRGKTSICLGVGG